MGYSANRKKELGITNDNSLSYTQRRKKELEIAQFNKQGSTYVGTGENKDAYAGVKQDSATYAGREAAGLSKPEQDALKAMDKIKNRPWYVPKGIATTIEVSKLSPEARWAYTLKKEEKDSKSANRAFGNAMANSLTLGALPAAEKYTHEKYGIGTDEFINQKAENRANHPVASTAGTVAGYLLPGSVGDKVAGKVLSPVLSGIGSKVAQKAITGAVTGGGMEAVEGVIRGDSPEELANRIAAGAGFGAVGDVALYGLGKGVSAILGKIKAGKAITKAESEVLKSTPELFSKIAKETDMPIKPKLDASPKLDVPQDLANSLDQYKAKQYNLNTLDNAGLKQLASEQGINPNQTKSQLRGALKQAQPETKIEPVLAPEVKPVDLPEPSNKVVMETPKEKPGLDQKMSDLYTKTVDKNNPIGKSLTKFDGGRTAMLASNTSNASGTVDYMLKDSLVDMQGNKIGKSLEQVIEPIPQGKEVDFWNYMSQRHNIDRAREGKNLIANYTSDMSKKAVEQIELTNPEWKNIGDDVVNWIDDFMREWGVNAGTVDEEIYNGLRDAYKSYFPGQREFSELEKSIPGDIRKQFVDVNSPIKKATGSARDIHNPVSNIINLVDRTVKTARYNEVGQSLLDSVRKQPEKLKALAEVIAPKDGMFSNVDNIVTVLEKGKPVYLQINDKALLDSLKGLPKVVNNAPVMRKISNVYKSLITQKNPIFAIRNMARDIPTAYIYGSETNPVKFTGDLLKAGKDIVTNSDNLQRYKALGGGGSNFLAGNADEAAKSLLKKPGPLKKLGGAIEKFNNLTETAPRLAEFNRVLKKTDDVQKALAAANDVTVNFARGGNLTKSLDPFVPYLNAGVQGLDKLFRQIKGKPLETLLKSSIIITVPEVALYLINKDDPDYQSLDNRTKDTYFLIPKGDGTFTKIPKSRELGVLFGSLFQRLARSSEGDKEAFKGFGNALSTSFSPTNPLENNILSPLVTNLPSNKDFAGRSIVPMNMQMDKRSKYLQYDERTTEIAKAIGKLAADVTGGEGLSPKQIDYIIKSYTGVIGQLGIPMTTKGGEPSKAITSQFIADPLYSNQVIQDFYDNYTEVQKKAADKNILDKIPSKKITPEESIEGKFRKASSKISDLNKQIRDAQGDEVKIRELRKQIVIIAKEANDMLK